WQFVGGLSSAFRTHGYGAEDPSAPGAVPARIRWVRTADESRNFQGPHTEVTGIGAVLGGVLGLLVGGPFGVEWGAALGGLSGAAAAPRADRALTKGTLHPNELGHKAIGDILVSAMHGVVWGVPAPRLDPTPPRVVSSSPFRDHIQVTFNKPIDPDS